jgi:hypothetical protein
MSEEVYQNLKKSLTEMYKRHKQLLKYSLNAGIGMSGNIQITISELEINIQNTEKQIRDYEATLQ